jgi:hypothetical protein
LYSVALKSFTEAQQDGSMDNIYLTLGDKAKYVTMKISLAFIMIIKEVTTLLGIPVFMA